MDKQVWSDETRPPPIVGSFFKGWTSIYRSKDDTSAIQEHFEDADDTSFSSRTSSLDNLPQNYQRRKSSVQVGNEVVGLLEKENIKNAIDVLQEALEHLNMAQDIGEDSANISKIYSQIIKTLCDPAISKLVDELTPGTKDKKLGIYNSVLWRLFTKIVESGHKLETDAHLAVVSTLVEKDHTALALQAMYAMRRKELDTQCYRTAVLLHLMQDPKQIMEAQRLISDYGKPYLDIANPTAPNDLPPLRIKMPLMEEVTENDQFKLWMFYQAAQLRDNDHWTRQKEEYELKRKENLSLLAQEEKSPIDWAMGHLNIETEKLKVDRQSTDNDNTMIYIAMKNQQFEYGWQVYKAMADSVNESTPCIVMQLCWVAFHQIPITDVSNRTDWESRAWSVYSRFMCSEYLHPEQPEAPSFIHDILCIAVHTPEVTIDKKARYTKTMSVYHLLVRLNFDKLLCDDRVLEPLLCTMLYECKGSPKNVVSMCKEAFEIRNRKYDSQHDDNSRTRTPFSMIWGFIILCVKAGDETNLPSVLLETLEYLKADVNVPSSLLAPIQTFHDNYTCNQNSCYFSEYMFKYIEYTDNLENSMPEEMYDLGILSLVSDKEEQYNVSWHTNIHEPQEPNITMAVMMGPAKEEILVKRQMYYSTNKAKALIQHICSLLSDRQTNFPT